MDDFAGDAEPLSRKGFLDTVDDLEVGIPELLAVLSVESRNCGFLPDRRPVILFERHVFHRRTGGRYSADHPDISNPRAGGYAGGAREYERLDRAAALDRGAALASASWGAGQVMGFNHAAAGFGDVEEMVAAMRASEDAHLASVAAFLKSHNLVRFLQTRDWAAFARRYNGPSFARNQYDRRLAGAFAKYAAGTLPDVEVRRAQLYLAYLGIDPGGIDGIHGKRSRAAVALFRERHGVGSGERVDRKLVDALQARVRERRG